MRHNLLVVPFLFLLACSSQNDAEDGATTESEGELSGACTLGDSCPSIKVLSARSFTTSRPPANRRSDVTVPLADPSFDLRVFSRTTSRVLEFDGTKKVTLAGNKEGTAEIRVDDFLLVEVLSTTGDLLNGGVVNANDVKVSDRPANAMAPIPAQNGPYQGWSYLAGAVNITHLLPTDRPFRLRVSAFDITGPALTTDVYLKVEDADRAPPPPTPPANNDDPFDPASCTGPAATNADFAGRFEPGGTLAYLGRYSISSRTRHCNAISGCAPWQDHRGTAFDMSTPNHDDRPAPDADPWTGALMLQVYGGKILPKFVTSTCWNRRQDSPTGQVCAGVAEGQPTPAASLGPALYGWSCWDLDNGGQHVRCGGYSYVSSVIWSGSDREWQPNKRVLRAWEYAPANGNSMPYAYAFIGKSCARVTASMVSSSSNGDRDEVEVAALARY